MPRASAAGGETKSDIRLALWSTPALIEPRASGLSFQQRITQVGLPCPEEDHDPAPAEGSPLERAPRGNLNALKSGKHSAQLKAALHAMLIRDEIRPILLAIVETRRRERMRYQALILATAKPIHNAELSPIIVRKLIDFLESDGAPRESGNA